MEVLSLTSLMRRMSISHPFPYLLTDSLTHSQALPLGWHITGILEYAAHVGSIGTYFPIFRMIPLPLPSGPAPCTLWCRPRPTQSWPFSSCGSSSSWRPTSACSPPSSPLHAPLHSLNRRFDFFGERNSCMEKAKFILQPSNCVLNLICVFFL